jgi:hypothetical protein
LSENILEILVICIDIAGVTKKIMLSNLQGMNNSGKFKVMGVGHTPRVLMQGRKNSRRRTPGRIPLYSY